MHVAAAVFDLYGTILNLAGMEEPIAAAGIEDAAGFVREWRRKHIEYAYLSSMAQAFRPFDDLSARALDHTCALRGVALDDAVRARFGELFRVMPAHADAVPALRALAARGVRTAVLTNGTRASARDALAHAGVLDLLDDVLSVESVGAYKPDPRVYALATERFACASRDIVFVSSNAWDAWGAAHFGFRVAWCNRGGGPAEALTPAPEVTLGALAELDAFVASRG